ncbi:unnamed protein product [Thelazia callipaeda]|uniref:Arginine/serine-rich coiled-coil protein 2 n=1 Tax=Thelazia callipaeda TaxID=103827 RepID=A0A158RD39_THECL|nr:unnamed protein product [Thelazia callipaeda]
MKRGNKCTKSSSYRHQYSTSSDSDSDSHGRRTRSRSRDQHSSRSGSKDRFDNRARSGDHSQGKRSRNSHRRHARSSTRDGISIRSPSNWTKSSTRDNKQRVRENSQAYQRQSRNRSRSTSNESHSRTVTRSKEDSRRNKHGRSKKRPQVEEEKTKEAVKVVCRLFNANYNFKLLLNYLVTKKPIIYNFSYYCYKHLFLRQLIFFQKKIETVKSRMRSVIESALSKISDNDDNRVVLGNQLDLTITETLARHRDIARIEDEGFHQSTFISSAGGAGGRIKKENGTDASAVIVKKENEHDEAMFGPKWKDIERKYDQGNKFLGTDIKLNKEIPLANARLSEDMAIREARWLKIYRDRRAKLLSVSRRHSISAPNNRWQKFEGLILVSNKALSDCGAKVEYMLIVTYVGLVKREKIKVALAGEKFFVIQLLLCSEIFLKIKCENFIAANSSSIF